MDLVEEQKIITEILKDRRLSYSFEVVDVQGDKYTILTNFGSTIIYFKKGNHFYLENEL